MLDRLDEMPGLGTTAVITLVALLIGLLLLRMVRRGEALFRRSPQRRVGLGALDVFVGLILMHGVVAVVFGLALSMWGPTTQGGMALAQLSEAQSLLVQGGALVTGMVAVLGYMALRVRGHRGWPWRRACPSCWA